MNEPKKFYIVWNTVKSEGYVTDDVDDAMIAAGEIEAADLGSGHSAIALEFIRSYFDDLEDGETLPAVTVVGDLDTDEETVYVSIVPF